MKLNVLALVLVPFAFSAAHADNGKYVEQLNSIYFCETPEAAAGLVPTFNEEDDFDQKQYVEATSGCGRLPPNAEAKLLVKLDTNKNGIVKIQVTEPALDGGPYLWIDTSQSFKLMTEYNLTLKDSPQTVVFNSAKVGCPSAEAAVEHMRLSRLATQTGSGAVFLGMTTKKTGKAEEFVCQTIKAGTNADMYTSRAKNGSTPFQLFDKARTTVWVANEL